MTDAAFTWACGKCGSGAIYRDGDSVACPVCGNRYYPVVIIEGKQKVRGVAPVKQYRTERPRVAIDEPHFMLERTENLIIRGEKFRIAAAPVLPKRAEKYDRNYDQERKGEAMATKRLCENCLRTNRTIIGRGLCGTCYMTARGLEGEERAVALAGAKARIEAKAAGIGREAPKMGNGEDKEKVEERPLRRVELKPRGLSIEVEKPEAQEIPVTVRLTLEINVRVLGVATA